MPTATSRLLKVPKVQEICDLPSLLSHDLSVCPYLIFLLGQEQVSPSMAQVFQPADLSRINIASIASFTTATSACWNQRRSVSRAATSWKVATCLSQVAKPCLRGSSSKSGVSVVTVVGGSADVLARSVVDVARSGGNASTTVDGARSAERCSRVSASVTACAGMSAASIDISAPCEKVGVVVAWALPSTCLKMRKKSTSLKLLRASSFI
mmetsp:Transcript_51013/g.111650  ORF Transcript_51013/g.111650 Transcript_51013/m.111650 type:complete len:210 (-) Transcript_51013:306-935(-)